MYVYVAVYVVDNQLRVYSDRRFGSTVIPEVHEPCREPRGRRAAVPALETVARRIVCGSLKPYRRAGGVGARGGPAWFGSRGGGVRVGRGRRGVRVGLPSTGTEGMSRKERR